MAQIQDAGAERPVPQSVFDLNSVDRRERYEIWRDSVSCIFQVDAERDVRDDGFYAKVDAHMFGPLMLVRTQSREHSWQRIPSVMARDGMDHYMIQLFEHGGMQWETEAGTRELRPRSLVVFDLAQEVRSRTPDFSNLTMIVPREMLEGSLKSPDDQHLRVLSDEEPVAALLREHMISLKRLASRTSLQQAIETAPATVGLAAACLNASINPDAPDQGAGVAMAQLATIRRFIEANLSKPELSADWIAKRVGVSRSKLYQLFDTFGGVGAYVRDRRLRRALLALTDKRSRHRPIYDIGLASGYTSDAAFSRAFRARYGIAPSDVRNRAYPLDGAGSVQGRIDRRYESWLHHLSV